MRQSELAGKAFTTLDRKLRRIILAEICARVIQTQIVDESGGDDVVEAEQVLLRITINAGVAVNVVARASDADCRRCRVTEVSLEVVGKVVIEPQCVPRFVLHNLTLQEKVSDVAGVEKVITGGWHEGE